MDESLLTLIATWLFHESNGPGFDSHSLFGALLGTCLTYSSRHRLKQWLPEVTARKRFKRWQRIGMIALCTSVGYLFAPLVQSLAPFLSSGIAGFVAAQVVIPVSIKVMLWLDETDLKELVQRWTRDR